MKKLQELQRERDLLRSNLQSKAKFNLFDEEFDKNSDLLRHLDKMFFRLARLENAKLSKFGRLMN